MSIVEKEELIQESVSGIKLSGENVIENNNHKNMGSYDKLTLPDKINFKYRFLLHKFSNFFNIRSKNRMIQIVYISTGMIPKDYILSLQKQYPNKDIKVIIPVCGFTETVDPSCFKFEYYFRNKSYEAKVIKYPETDNIHVYGIYSETFSLIENNELINQFAFISPYAKCARIFAKKLKADIIHSENIPFYLGAEFEKRQKNKFKVMQTYQEFNMFELTEPFWAAINLADKFVMGKIFKDKIIKKYLAKLFNLNNIKKQKTFDKCLEYFYENYDKFRNEVDISKNIEQNSIIRSLNKRIIKMFPESTNKKSKEYNLQYYSSKKSNKIIVISNSLCADKEFSKKTSYLQQGFNNKYENKIIYKFTKDNFRNIRSINKNYLQREFGKSKIESKFTDRNLLQDEEVDICGYLDVIRTSAIVFAMFESGASEEDYKSVIIPVLKAFELNKDIQFIINAKNASENTYVKSLIDFFESQKALEGRWLYLDGKINLPQFFAASDIFLVNNGQGMNAEEILYTSLKYGCIPVVLKKLKENYILKDIFDDMTTGCCFKLPFDSPSETSDYEELLLKVLNFYLTNSSSWNLIMQNAMNYDSSWNFEKIEAFNNVYEELI